MKRTSRLLLAAAILALTLVVLVAGTLFLGKTFFNTNQAFPRGSFNDGLRLGDDYASNGARIYFTGTSRSGPPIRSEMTGMHRMGPGSMACASCHGPEAEGGTVRMMMGAFEAPNIRWGHLTAEEHDHEEGEADKDEGHPTYTEESLKRAITDGLNPAGEELDWVMPRWEMSETQLDDLVSYLMSLD